MNDSEFDDDISYNRTLEYIASLRVDNTVDNEFVDAIKQGAQQAKSTIRHRKTDSFTFLSIKSDDSELFQLIKEQQIDFLKQIDADDESEVYALSKKYDVDAAIEYENSGRTESESTGEYSLESRGEQTEMVPWNVKKSNTGSLDALRNLANDQAGYFLNLCTVYNDTHYFKQLPLNNTTIDTFENLIRHQTKSNFIKKRNSKNWRKFSSNSEPDRGLRSHLTKHRRKLKLKQKLDIDYGYYFEKGRSQSEPEEDQKENNPVGPSWLEPVKSSVIGGSTSSSILSDSAFEELSQQPSYSQILKGTQNQPPDQASILTDCETLQNRRNGKKAFRAQQKADLEYAEIQEEQKKLERRLQVTHLTSATSAQMDKNPKKKGKIRETPKQKKPTPLKRVILKEREEKKTLRDQQANLILEANSDVPALPPILDGIAGPECSEIQDVVEASRIHSRRFREYCDQVIDKQIDELASFILSELNRFYQRQLQKNQIKAKSKRRFVLGIREVFKHLKLNKIKCVVVSPNLEKIQSKGGLDDVLSQLLLYCEENQIPIVFALGRRALGRACGKFVPVSIVGIFDYSGVDEKFHQLISTVNDARDRYQKLVNTVARDIDSQKERVQEARQAKIEEEIEAEKKSTRSEKSTDTPTQSQSNSENSTDQNSTGVNTVVENGIHESTEELMSHNEDEPPIMINGETSNREISLELIEKLKSERKSFQCHSRNVSAASAFSACSLVSQTHSDRDWREIAGDELQVGVEGNQTEEIGTDLSVDARVDGPETDGQQQPVQQKTIVEKA